MDVCGEGLMESSGDIHSGFKIHSDNEAGEPFHCLICLDLVYKPIVHACGHIFCFWCAHRAMNPMGNSQCPICRRLHVYFPRICEMLHFFLMKAVPEEYSRRAQETRSMENTRQIFSPRIPDSPLSAFSKPSDQDGWDCITPSQDTGHRLAQVPSMDGSESEEGPRETQLDACASSAILGLDHSSASPSRETGEDFRQFCNSDPEDQTITERLTSQDFACASCRRLLYRPVVLNCGQVFCESCVETSDSVQMCPSCADPHLGETVHVCLELHQYLERTFPAYSSSDRPAVVSSRKNTSHKAVAIFDSTGEVMLDQDNAEEEDSFRNDPHFVHVGAGCDGCGMLPIIGDRYSCTECCERIGYDLCGRCMKKGCYMEGRFSQAHRPSHRFRRIASEWRVGLGGPLSFHMGGEIIRRRRGQQQQRLMFLELQF